MNHPDIRSVFGRRLLLADGSTGTALEALAPGRSAALLPLEDPDLVEGLHRAYFEAGSDLVETATFGADERGLAKLGAKGEARRLNRAASQAAARAARKTENGDGKPRWVAGSVGPGDDPPSLGGVSYEELAASYLPQTLGLIEGGVDLVVIETCQDPLQIKAAIGALRDAEAELGRSIPFVVSATVDAAGRLLAGTGMEALAAIIAPFRPLALGLNCSGGPGMLEAPLSELARVSPLPLSLMPNAGLPTLEGLRVVYPMGPEEFARATAELVRRFGAALAGGCCGTGPDHIRALSRLLSDRPAPSQRPPRRPALASLYEAYPPALTSGTREAAAGGFLRVGERANAAGSTAFSKLVLADDLEGQAVFALAQEERKAHALDLHLARPGRDESADLAALASRLAGTARAALSLDSANAEALAAALPKVGGRPLFNSVNLEDEERARRLFRLAGRFGAAVVCLALDAKGPAREAEAKASVCRSLYDIALEEGLAPEDLYFDCLTFALVSESRGFEGAAARTLRAIPLVKSLCPGASTILGVGNISYGLPKPLRPSVAAVFLDAALRAGLDAAILDPGLPELRDVRMEIRESMNAFLRIDSSAAERAAAMDALLALDPGQAIPPAAEELSTVESPSERLRVAIYRGQSRAAEEAAGDLLASGGAAALTKGVADSMAGVGKAFAEGALPLPRVLRGAEAAEAALGALSSSLERTGASPQVGKTIVLATVKGDLHDIGKNLTGLILASSGYRVVDLGVDVPTERLIEAVRRERPLALGLSGLLTRSLDEMRRAAEALEAENSPVPLLLGGAAVHRDFVREHLAPLRPGRVLACADAFEALRVLEGCQAGAVSIPAVEADGGEPAHPRSAAHASTRGGDSNSPPPQAPSGGASWDPPFWGSRVTEELPLDELLEALDRRTLLRVRWGYGGERAEEAEDALRRVTELVRSRGLSQARGVYGYFPCANLGSGRLRVDDRKGGFKDFHFPVERTERRRTVAGYFRESGDFVPFFAITVGPAFSKAALELKGGRSYEAYFQLHGFAAALAEAAAEVLHNRIARELREAGISAKGKRYSFGFPACPGVEAQGELLALLGAERIGLRATEGHQLLPEFSVTALIVPRGDAEYFTVSGLR